MSTEAVLTCADTLGIIASYLPRLEIRTGLLRCNRALKTACERNELWEKKGTHSYGWDYKIKHDWRGVELVAQSRWSERPLTYRYQERLYIWSEFNGERRCSHFYVGNLAWEEETIKQGPLNKWPLSDPESLGWIYVSTQSERTIHKNIEEAEKAKQELQGQLIQQMKHGVEQRKK